MEFIIQKAVELGVYGIIPMKTDRAIVKLDSKKEETKRKRWAAIAESAAKQSGRTVIPEIYPVMNFKEAVKFGKEFEFPLIPYELAEEMGDTKKILSEIKDGVKVGIYIGPEGGFEKEEISYEQYHHSCSGKASAGEVYEIPVPWGPALRVGGACLLLRRPDDRRKQREIPPLGRRCAGSPTKPDQPAGHRQLPLHQHGPI